MWWWLSVSIVTEVCATVCLRYSNGFSKLAPSVAVFVGYGIAFFAMSQALRLGMTIATAYAVWSAIGIAAIAILGIILFDEPLSRVQVLGLVLVTLGVMALQTGHTAS